MSRNLVTLIIGIIIVSAIIAYYVLSRPGDMSDQLAFYGMAIDKLDAVQAKADDSHIHAWRTHE